QSAAPDKPDTTAAGSASAADGTVKLSYADLVPEDDFGGYTFTFANDPLSVEYYSAIDIAQLTGETLDDAIYERNRRVEEKYNIVIDALNTGAPDLIRSTVTAGSGDIDVGYVLQKSVMGLISGGYLRPVTSLPVIDMSKPYWDQGAQDMLMINGDMFHGYLDISFDHYESMATIFYNGKMLEDYNLGDPYELFNGGIWTMERMYNMMTTVSGDVNGDGKVTVADDRLGFVGREFEYLPNLYASDAMLAEIVAGGDDIRLVSNLATERIIAIGEFANKLYTDKTISVIARDDATRNMFKEGRALFFSRLLGDFRNLRDKEDDYGLILYPSYEENTENIRVYIQNAFAMVIPVDIIEEDIAGTILQALAADCYDNVMNIYFEKAVIAKGTRDANSESMLRYMREHRAFDICYTFGLSPLLSAYTAAVSNKNFASVAEKYAKSVNIAMEKAISDYLEAIQTSG
ncbi:MAG: extracellular solute-binding protein, partial [Eubacteriales bacterium]|nr:extracellular solute-binding protein [Eubacteriales bacterium]